MKKFIPILFLFAYLCATTEIGQLLKLPFLVQHYQEHKAENPEMNFYEYLCLHYNYDDDHDNDQAKDMQLPFKSHTSCMQSAVTIAMLPAPVPAAVVPFLFPSPNRVTAIYKDLFIPSSYLSNIWQPPRRIC